MKFLDQIKGLAQTVHVIKDPNKLFIEIIGHREVKDAFHMFLESDENCNVLCSGPPGCDKTGFLLAMLNFYGKSTSEFIDGSAATGPGMFDMLLDTKRDIKILLIDELDGLKPLDQKTLLNLFETGILKSVKVRKTKERQFKNLKVFGTCNEVDKLIKPLRSRFFMIHFNEYSENEFLDIATKLYPKKDTELVEYVAKATWHVLKSTDIRDFQKIIKHIKNSEEADKLISLQLKYSKKEEI